MDRTHRWALLAGVAVVVGLQVALFAGGDTDATRSERPAPQLLQLPETDAPLADVARTLTPRPADETAPRRADVSDLASIPTVPMITTSDRSEPIMFLERLDDPVAEENPAVTYASVSDFLVSARPNPQALRPIDDRPVEVLAAIASSRRGGIGADGPHCVPGRPAMFTRSPVVSGVALRTPRM
jgi:hypothetical protein